MIANLFSSFDPSTNFNSTLNWIRTLLIFLFIPPTYWLIPSRWNFIWILIINTLHKEFKVLLKENSSKGRSLIFTSLFRLILFNNFLGLFPYIFTATSHLTLTLTLSLPLWLSFIIYNIIFNFINILAHLAPQGAPQILLPFLVIIETIRNIIRPRTLAIRLSANIIAGHLLITLLRNSGSIINIPILRILILAQILLLILETAVSIIQAYVFSILMTLYSREN